MAPVEWKLRATILTYVPSSLDPPYLASIGEEVGDAVVGFDYMGQLSEFPRRQIIPIATAREVMREYLETGMLSNRIAWEES